MPAALKRPGAAVDRELGSETAASGSEGEVIRSLEKAVTKQELASVTPKAKVQAKQAAALAAKSRPRSMAPPAAVPTRRAKTEPQDDERDVGPDGLTRAAAKARWRRALPASADSRVQNPGSRPKRSNVSEIPPEVYEAIRKDVNLESQWFSKFRKGGCSWDTVDLEEIAEETHMEDVDAGMRWANEKQIADHYKDPQLAADLCEEAENDTTMVRVRYHARFPGREEYRQFYVDWVEESISRQRNAHTKRLRASVAADQDMAMDKIMPRLAPPPGGAVMAGAWQCLVAGLVVGHLLSRTRNRNPMSMPNLPKSSRPRRKQRLRLRRTGWKNKQSARLHATSCRACRAIKGTCGSRRCQVCSWI